MKYLIVFFIVRSMIGEFVPRYEADMQCWKYLYLVDNTYRFH